MFNMIHQTLNGLQAATGVQAAEDVMMTSFKQEKTLLVNYNRHMLMQKAEWWMELVLLMLLKMH